MGAVAFVAFHVVAAGAKGENIGTASGICFERSVCFGNEIKNRTLTVGNLGNDAVTPKYQPDAATDDQQEHYYDNPDDDFTFFRHRLFALFFVRRGAIFGGFLSGRLAGFELTAGLVEIKNLGRA